MGKRVYLGLGSNLGNKERIVRKAIDKVGERVGAVDDKLDEHSYIVPGLGDAGDLAYGIKE